MITTTLTLQTDATNRTIRHTIQALIKAKAISSAYKIPYIKQYNTNEKGTLTTNNIQWIIVFPSENREKSGKNILDNVLKSWSISDISIPSSLS
jgi:hypothetical protein